MKKNIKQLVLFVIILIAIIFIQNKVEAKSYYIKNMDIQANININGSVDIEQTLTYNFNGEYNGIYITVPYKVTDNEYKDIIKNNRINDNLYTGSEVNVESVSEITEKTENSYRVVPMLDKVVRILQEYKKKVQAEQEELAELGEGFKEDDFIFKTKYNHPITSEYLRKTCQEICKSNNFRKVGIHELRHTFATRSIEAGIDLRVL